MTTTAGLSIIVPVFNEEGAIEATVRAIRSVCDRAPFPCELVVVDDGSTDQTAERLTRLGIAPIRHDHNLGYGAAIKTGISRARYPLIGLIDADSTYPAEAFLALMAAMDTCDMAIGARSGQQLPLLRRPGKWLLRRLAMYITGVEIPDLNSGLRVFRKELFERFAAMFPEGFSFTTTITMIALTNAYRVTFVPIAYHRRVGQSSIHPVRDFIGFTMLIVRLAVYFKPLSIFLPVSLALLGIGMTKAAIDFIRLNHFGAAAAMVILAALQVGFLGLLADLILHRTRV